MLNFSNTFLSLIIIISSGQNFVQQTSDSQANSRGNDQTAHLRLDHDTPSEQSDLGLC